MSSFLTGQELADVGFKSIGEHVLVSRKASIYRPEVITLGSNVRIDDFCLLSGGGGIVLGSYIHIAAYAAIYGGGGVIMEDYSGLSPRALLLSETDDFSGNSMIHPFFPRNLKPGFDSRAIRLRRFSQVGTGSTLLPGVELEEGVAIGAHSLVKKSCPAWGIYAGIPAVCIGDRSRNILHLADQFHSQD